MKQTRILMGMPVTVEVVSCDASQAVLDEIFSYFMYIDEKFSTYKVNSEISLINDQGLTLAEASQDMQTVFSLSDQFRRETFGYFDICRPGRPDRYDPSGLVKGWAVSNAAVMLRQQGFENFYVEAGGDFQAVGKNSQGENWRVGVRNPFNIQEIVKVLSISDLGVATSGTYIRGQHIYNPHGDSLSTDVGSQAAESEEVLSLTVVGPDICAADCYATAAFAMGRAGIAFIESLDGFEGYSIAADHQATLTSGFRKYVLNDQMD